MGAPTHQLYRTRRDGWTAERQLRFLDALARTRSGTRAAAFAGMSRESAYRLRNRRDGALFAAAWDRAMKGPTLVNLVAQHVAEGAPVSPANPPKVTKWKKWTTPGFNSMLDQLRDPMAPAPCPAPRPGSEDNRAYNATRGFRGG